MTGFGKKAAAKDQAIKDALEGRPSVAQSVSCTVPGCQAADYWMPGDRRDEKRARRWIGNHKKHSQA